MYLKLKKLYQKVYCIFKFDLNILILIFFINSLNKKSRYFQKDKNNLNIFQFIIRLF